MSTHTITGTSPASATTAVLGGAIGVGQYDALRIVGTIQGGTGGTLDIYLQTSVDGTVWHDYAHFAQLADGASQIIRSFSVARQAQQTSILTIGSGTSPALAANSVVGGDFGNQMRVVCVAGASTSAGATQTITITGVLRRV